MTTTILQGDCRDVIPTLPENSIHCCVTSPPYFGLRDYGVDGQIGIEQTPEEFISEIVNVFNEVWRVLRNDGTVWLNLGDSYASHGGVKQPDRDSSGNVRRSSRGQQSSMGSRGGFTRPRTTTATLKEKNLLGTPWRVAFALQEAGWILRQDIIWHKPNPMPESVRDRCTKAHEYLFLLSKSPRYYYDIDAVKEDGAGRIDLGNMTSPARINQGGDWVNTIKEPQGRNRRSVWTIATQPYSGAHFATFPEKLIEPCILAGAPKGGTVLDPFGGSGTTARVAAKHGRNAILIELNSEYIELQKERTSNVQVNLF